MIKFLVVVKKLILLKPYVMLLTRGVISQREKLASDLSLI
jgi:hypothetical protein